MQQFQIIVLFLFYFINSYGQAGFRYTSDKNKIKIPFQFINNLIFIPMNVNGVELTFLLDTGVEETILFSLQDKEHVEFKQVETIRIRGLGNAAPIEGLKSSRNKVVISDDFIDYNHTIYVLLSEEVNISAAVGIPVNGIMGYGFFKDYPMKIDYINQKISIHEKRTSKVTRTYRKYKKFSVILENNKPYIETSFMIDTIPFHAKLLVDVGNSDAIWLFSNQMKSFSIPKNSFNDLLGHGFSGPVFGERAMLSSFGFDGFSFNKPIIAFPDSLSIKNVKLVPNRIGSIGAEILRRFSVFIDYKNAEFGFKKNKYYATSFTYNISGLEIQHNGLQWIAEKIKVNADNVMKTAETMDFSYKFNLKPVFIIVNARKGSPAALAGLKKNDIILTINKKEVHLYSLEDINRMLKSEDGKHIIIEVERLNQLLKFEFVLKSIF